MRDPDPAPIDDHAEPDPVGEIRRPATFGIGARATILMGLTMSAMATASMVLPAASSVTSIT